METTTLLNGFKETGTLAYETPQAQYQPFTCFVINTADHSIKLDWTIKTHFKKLEF